MRFEHFGINVPNATAMAKWYVENCRLKIIKAVPMPNQAHFLADQTGKICMEIYTNPNAPIPDYKRMPPLIFHFAFAADPLEHKAKLLKAGAEVFEDIKLDDGSHIITFRDPWGVPFQLCKRAIPF